MRSASFLSFPFSLSTIHYLTMDGESLVSCRSEENEKREPKPRAPSAESKCGPFFLCLLARCTSRTSQTWIYRWRGWQVCLLRCTTNLMVYRPLIKSVFKRHLKKKRRARCHVQFPAWSHLDTRQPTCC